VLLSLHLVIDTLKTYLLSLHLMSDNYKGSNFMPRFFHFYSTINYFKHKFLTYLT